jgi:hypothetical protein
MDRINILWTGGYDSTYRVCELSLLPVEVQPYYIDACKRSNPNEYKAMADIEKVIRGNPLKKCVLLPIITIRLCDLDSDKEIEDAYTRIRSEVDLGSQYVWLAKFAKQNGIRVELGFEKNDGGRVYKYFDKYGAYRDVTIALEAGSETLSYREFDGSRTSEDLMILFGSFRFGLPLIETTKLGLVEAYKKIGYKEVIPLTWFCAHPLKGKPCGLCNPCASVMKAGMGFRMPLRGKFLYYLLKANPVGRYLDKKMKTVYNKKWRKHTEP